MLKTVSSIQQVLNKREWLRSLLNKPTDERTHDSEGCAEVLFLFKCVQ